MPLNPRASELPRAEGATSFLLSASPPCDTRDRLEKSTIVYLDGVVTKHLRRISRYSTAGARRRRLTAWLVFLLCGVLLRGWPVQSQPMLTEPEEEEPVEVEEAEPFTGYADPDEAIAGRFTALPIAANARIMAFTESVAARREAGAAGVVVGYIHEEIELGIAYYVDRTIQTAEEQNAALLVFDLDTWGGRVDAAVMIKDAILATDVPTIVFVNKKAISAGALIALAHDLIVVANGASMGAATPIQLGAGGQAQPVEEKVVSALRSEFRSTAQATSRSGEIAEFMADAQLEVGGVIEPGKLLTMTRDEAMSVGMAEIEADGLDEILALFGLEDATITEVEESWSETLVRFLTSAMISGLLMTLGMLGLFFELMSPGFGWAGAMGVAALTLFFAGHLLVHLAGWEEMLLFVVGIGLLLLEVFVIPGFGVAGVLGLVAVGASLTLALVSLDIDISLSPSGFSGAVSRVFFSLVGTVVGAVVLFKYVPRTRAGQRLVLQEALASGPSVRTGGDGLAVGMTGVAITDLRPFGKARFANKRVEVVSEGEYLEKGAEVRISRVAGPRIEVRPLTSLEEAEADDNAAGDGQEGSTET